jgi:hypothetical protein
MKKVRHKAKKIVRDQKQGPVKTRAKPRVKAKAVLGAVKLKQTADKVALCEALIEASS